MPDIGYYTLPVILSMEGIDKQVNSKLGKAFGDVGKKSGKDFSKGLGDGLKSTEADVKKAADAYSKLKDKAADALGKVRKEEAALQDLRNNGITGGARFVAVEERLATARRNSSRATREASDSHTVLLSAQKRLGDGSDDLGGRFGKLSGVAARVGPALAGAGAIAGGAALAGIAALGAGVLLAGNRLYELGAQFDDLSDNLQVKTGLSGAALDQLKESVERLGTTNVPSSFGEIGDVAAEVTRNLHLTGPEFDAVTSRLANLQRMGVDVNIRSLGKAFRGFGIDAKEQAPALNSLYEASTKSGLSIDELTAAVAKGGPALRQLGLDFGESAALIATFEEAGLDGEKGMAALTKAFAYFSKEGIPAEQGLRDIITQIQNLGDTPAAGELANKVFGAKGGAAFLEAIQNGTLDLQSLSDSLQSTGLDINQVSEDTADWSEEWQDLKNEIAVALEPLATRVFDSVNEELGKLADWTTAHKDDIIDFFEDLGQFAITGAENFAHGIGGILQALGDMLGGIGNVKGALDSTMAFFADLRGDDVGAAAFRESAQEAFGWGEDLRAAGDKLTNLNLDPLRDGLHNIGEEAKGADEKIGGIGNALGKLPATTNSVVNITDGTGKQIPFDQFLGINNAPPPPGATVPGRNPLAVIAPPRAAGGLFSKMPSSARIQPAVDGLIQWAEPSTGGEAFIPLRGGERSQRIWAETGRRLFSFEAGGFRSPDVMAAMSMVGTAYSQGNRTDCSGMVARVINRVLGLPDSG